MQEGLARVLADWRRVHHVHAFVLWAGSEPARSKVASLVHAAGHDLGRLRMASNHSPLSRHMRILQGFRGSAHARLRERRLEPDPLSMFSRPTWGVFYGHDWSAFPGHRTILTRARERLRLRLA